jgi:cytochrome oxidase Cu insertion factor (SCO1/SenC/PrrC family)
MQDASPHPNRKRLPFGLLAAIVAGALPVGAVVAVIVGLSAGGSGSTLATNPELDPGTPLTPKPAPNFTLTDQFGQPVTLSSFRGKVVVLAFEDSQCVGVCPLTTAELLLAKRMLGKAASEVQLLGVDANPNATTVADVRAYSVVHGLMHKWLFLTGPLPELKQVWREYGIEARVVHGLVDHTPGVFLINREGDLVRVFLTQMYYAARNQQAQIIARAIAKLLPGNPPVHSNLGYERIPPLSPTAKIELPLFGGAKTTVGATGSPHLLLFWATWDREVENLAGNLEGLNRYAEQARELGLPEPIAVDLTPVEPSPTAAASFLETLRSKPTYPVASDQSGRVADLYGVEEAPWFVLTAGNGKVLWYYDAAAEGWPTTERLLATIKRLLQSGGSAAQAASLAGSPPPLAALHSQASQLLGGGLKAFKERLANLVGYPVVVNLWASWCTPCQREEGYFQRASLRFGRKIAFVGADIEDPVSSARSFLSNHPLSYPSYQLSLAAAEELAPVTGVPDTIFYSATGRLLHLHIGEYSSEAALVADIERYG